MTATAPRAPLIEVVLCTYNGERYLEMQLASILAQSRPVDRLLVCDDASTDGTVALLERIAARHRLSGRAPEIAIHVRERNLGYGRNFWNAIAASRGELLFLCDQDDAWHRDKVQRLEAAFADAAIGLAFSDGDLTAADGSRLGAAGVLAAHGLGRREIARFAGDPLRELLRRNCINGAAAAVRGDIARGAPPLPDGVPPDQWLAMWCCAAGAGIACLPDRLYGYRQHGSNAIGIGHRKRHWALAGLWRSAWAARERECRIYERYADWQQLLGTTAGLRRIAAKGDWLARMTDRRLPRAALARRIVGSLLAGSYRRYGTADTLLRDLFRVVRAVKREVCTQPRRRGAAMTLPRVGFVTLSPPAQPLPSTRIAVLNVLPLLREHGWDASVVHALATPGETPALPPALFATIAAAGCDVVVFQKMRGPGVVALATALEAAGIRTVYQVCDLVEPAMAQATSATIAVTEFLRGLYPAPLQDRIHVVHDGIEHPEQTCAAPDPARGAAAPLRAVLVSSVELEQLPVIGLPPPWLQVTIVARYPPRSDRRRARWRTGRWSLLRQPDWRARRDYLRFATHPRIVREAWDAEGVYRHLRAADVGIIPVDARPTGDAVPPWQVKSENRLTLKMALGLPVVATPIPSYLPVLTPGVDGYFATTRAEWLDHLDRLRDPALRRSVGAAARASVLARYSKDEQARRMAAVFDRVLTAAPVTAGAVRR